MPRFPTNRSGHEHSRIVITGIGVVSPAGRTVGQFWRSLTTPPMPATHASSDDGDRADGPAGMADFSGRIDDFGDLPTATRKAIRKSLKLMNRETKLGVAAGQQALADSGLLEWDGAVRERTGVCFGADNVSILPEDFRAGIEACSGEGGEFDFDRWGTLGLAEVEPLWILKCLPNMPACHLAIVNDLQGPNNTITQRDVGANMAVAEAVRKLTWGDADAMLVGATGTTLSAFNQIRARWEGDVAAECESAVCRPFDRRRQGPAPGEGAAAFVLEKLEIALQRGAPIYGEILAAAAASRLGHDGAAACGRALVGAMKQSLKRSGLRPESVGHVHAHGLGTMASDAAEAAAIRDVFGTHCLQTPVVAAKSRLSNAGTGAGAIELVASLLALKQDALFPLWNSDEPDPTCQLRLVQDGGVPAGDSFLNLSMFGRGLASCVAVGRYHG